jgi:hypothetical protein
MVARETCALKPRILLFPKWCPWPCIAGRCGNPGYCFRMNICRPMQSSIFGFDCVLGFCPTYGSRAVGCVVQQQTLCVIFCICRLALPSWYTLAAKMQTKRASFISDSGWQLQRVFVLSVPKPVKSGSPRLCRKTWEVRRSVDLSHGGRK